MTTTIQYALMAGASYVSNRDKINRLPIPDGWLQKKYENPPGGSGFEAVSFVKDSEIVISYAGTGPGWGDWIHGNTPLASVGRTRLQLA